jgi:hypothetical protein
VGGWFAKKKQQRGGGLQGFGFRSLRPLVDGWLLKQLRDLSFISPTRFSYCFSNNSRIFPNIIIWYFMSGQSIELAFPCCKLSHLCHPTTGHQYMPHATCHMPPAHLPSFPCCLSSSSCVETLSCPEDLVLYTCESTIPAHLDARYRQSF